VRWFIPPKTLNCISIIRFWYGAGGLSVAGMLFLKNALSSNRVGQDDQMVFDFGLNQGFMYYTTNQEVIQQ
jgi:hypothetical protein